MPENMLKVLGSGFWGGAPTSHTTAQLGTKKVFWIPRMSVSVLHNARKYHVRSQVAPQPPIPLHSLGQKRCFWIRRVGVFELHNARKDRVGSGVATQAPIPLHTLGQKRCFWISRVGVLELHYNRKYQLGSGADPNHCTPGAHQGPEKVFLDP